MKFRLRLAVILTGFPVLLAMGLYVYRRYNPIEMPTYADVNEKCMELQRKWRKAQFTSIASSADISAGVRRLVTPVAGAENQKSLCEAVGRIVSSMKAKTFAEYYSARTGGQSFAIRENTAEGQRAYVEDLTRTGMLKYVKGTKLPLPSDSTSIYEIIWIEATKNGRAALTWDAVSWNSSWVAYAEIDQEKFLIPTDFLGSISVVPETCGVISTESTFEYSPTPNEILKAKGKLKTAVVYILFKTAEKKAYPILFQFYWMPSRDEWLPINLAVGYLGRRPPDPLF